MTTVSDGSITRMSPGGLLEFQKGVELGSRQHHKLLLGCLPLFFFNSRWNFKTGSLVFNESHMFRECDLISLACVYTATTIIKTKDQSAQTLTDGPWSSPLPIPTTVLFVVFAFSKKLQDALVMLVYKLCVAVGPSRPGTCGGQRLTQRTWFSSSSSSMWVLGT